MKSLLTIVTDAAQAPAQIAAAASFARTHDAHLDVLALGVDHSERAYGPTGSYLSLVQIGIERAEADAAGLNSVAEKALATEAAGLRWSSEAHVAQAGTLIDLVGYRARLSDLVILPQPYGEGRTLDAEAVLEMVLFDARTPVLVVPEAGIGTAAAPNRVVIAWNRSAEAMAAIRAAMPLLKAAQRVNIAVIDPASHGSERSDPGGMLCAMLSRHGVAVEVSVLARTMPRVADVLNRHLIDQAADLLVMGAYGHSRLREALFGGATRDMLHDSPVAMLMAH